MPICMRSLVEAKTVLKFCCSSWAMFPGSTSWPHATWEYVMKSLVWKPPAKAAPAAKEHVAASETTIGRSVKPLFRFMRGLSHHHVSLPYIDIGFHGQNATA